jgi:integrase
MVFKAPSDRDRLILELMARGGMRIGEVLKLTLADVDGKKLRLVAPKSGRPQEHVYLPKSWPPDWART